MGKQITVRKVLQKLKEEDLLNPQTTVKALVINATHTKPTQPHTLT